jgi:hypothetical protein
MKNKLEKLVVIESPFRGKGYHETELNILYAKACVHDCLNRGEYPYASHLFYTQNGILDDKNPKERNLGIKGGLAWGNLAPKRVVYIDRGISRGMKKGISAAKKQGKIIEYRNLPNYKKFLKKAKMKISEKEWEFKH